MFKLMWEAQPKHERHNCRALELDCLKGKGELNRHECYGLCRCAGTSCFKSTARAFNHSSTEKTKTVSLLIQHLDPNTQIHDPLKVNPEMPVNSEAHSALLPICYPWSLIQLPIPR